MAAKKLPSFDGLTEYDFQLFTREKWGSSNYDAGRLAVKRKLAAIGKHVEAGFKEAGVELTHKTSLHNPCRYNSNKVRMLKVYFARSKKARKPLKDLLGPALSGDLDPHYVNVQMWLKVQAAHVEFSLSVHPDAWWDSQHLVRQCETADGRRALLALLKPLPDYHLMVHDMALHECAGLEQDFLARVLKNYRPGDHWLHVLRRMGTEDVVEQGADFLETARAEFERLVPVYDAFAWSP